MSRSHLEDVVGGILEICEVLLTSEVMGELTVLAEPGLRDQFESTLRLIGPVEDSVIEAGLSEPARTLRGHMAALGEMIWPKQGAPSNSRAAIADSLDQVYADIELLMMELIRVEPQKTGGGRIRRQRLRRLATSRMLLEGLKAGGVVKLPVGLRIANRLSSLQAWLAGKLAG